MSFSIYNEIPCFSESKNNRNKFTEVWKANKSDLSSYFEWIKGKKMMVLEKTRFVW